MLSQKILIVEDEEDVASLLKKRLEMAGYKKIENATDGIQAVQSIHQFQPDLVLLDILLPGGSGYSVLRKVKMSSRTREIPVIVITSLRTPGLKEQMEREGVLGFFQKPYKNEELLQKIQEAIGPADVQTA